MLSTGGFTVYLTSFFYIVFSLTCSKYIYLCFVIISIVVPDRCRLMKNGKVVVFKPISNGDNYN